MLADLSARSGVTTKFLSNIGATLRTTRSPLQSSGTVNLQKIAVSPSHASPPSPPLIYVALVAQAKYLLRDRASVSSLALVAFAHLVVGETNRSRISRAARFVVESGVPVGVPVLADVVHGEREVGQRHRWATFGCHQEIPWDR